MPVPVLANMTEFGRSPLLDVNDLRAAGVRLVLYPLTAFRAMSAAAEHVYGTLRREGTQRELLATMQTREDLYHVLDYRRVTSENDANLYEFGGTRIMSMTVADKPKTAGLAGVVAGQTAISTVGKEGVGLTYRGYAIEDLAREASFEEVAHLLIYEELPTQSAGGRVSMPSDGPAGLARRLAGDSGTDSRLGPSDGRAPHRLLGAGCLEPEHRQADQEKIADRLLATLPSMLLDWHLTSQRGAANRSPHHATEPCRPLLCNCCTAGRPTIASARR